MVARTSRTVSAVLGLCLVLALGTGCNRQRGSMATAPEAREEVATAQTAPAARSSTHVEPPPFTPAKGIGASGGPAGREDLRPDRSP